MPRNALFVLLGSLLVAAGCGAEPPAVAPDGPPLYVPVDGTLEQRRAFARELASHTDTLYALYDAWVERIGANGILDGIEAVRPGCHSEAHDLGKVVHDRVGSVGQALRACDRRCHSGCMHGVLMAAFTEMCTVEGQLRLELLAGSVENVCLAEPQMQADYAPGDCAHGVGHALMFLADYTIDRALDACESFGDSRLRYYCATGAFMEFVTAGRADEQIAGRSFAPCDVHRYPMACARYLLPRWLDSEMRETGSAERMFELCRAQQGLRRTGCFHGLGNALMRYVERGVMPMASACLQLEADARQVCIDGVFERMGRYFPARAAIVCSELDGRDREICARAIEGGMYRMDRDPRLYARGDA